MSAREVSFCFHSLLLRYSHQWSAYEHKSNITVTKPQHNLGYFVLFRSCKTQGINLTSCKSHVNVNDDNPFLFQVTLNVGPDQDLAILHEVRQSNAHTKKIQDELKSLKAKIYGLENELRFSWILKCGKSCPFLSTFYAA